MASTPDTESEDPSDIPNSFHDQYILSPQVIDNQTFPDAQNPIAGDTANDVWFTPSSSLSTFVDLAVGHNFSRAADISDAGFDNPPVHALLSDDSRDTPAIDAVPLEALSRSGTPHNDDLATSSTLSDRKPDPPTQTCVRCTYQKKKCLPLNALICYQCFRSRIPASLCIRVRLFDEPIFQKWADANYQSRLRWPQLRRMATRRPLKVYHYLPGPSIIVDSCEFVPSEDEQTKLWGKTEAGWTSIQTRPFGLHPESHLSDSQIAEYVSGCIPHCLAELDQRATFRLMAEQATATTTADLLFVARCLLTANCLLAKGWQVTGVAPVVEPNSPYFGMSPAPRVLQNEMDLRLESYASELEVQLLKRLHVAMTRRKASWIQIYCTVITLLAVVERDVWRLMYWMKHREETYKWRHPESAIKLVERIVFYVNILLTNLHFSGVVPEEFASIVGKVRPKNASSSYRETDISSLDDILTRLGMTGGCHDIRLVKLEDFR